MWAVSLGSRIVQKRKMFCDSLRILALFSLHQLVLFRWASCLAFCYILLVGAIPYWALDKKMHTKIVQRFLSVICICIFGYYAYQSLTDYLSYNTVSKHSKERQEEQLMPQIYFSSPYVAERGFRNWGLPKANMPRRDFGRAVWSTILQPLKMRSKDWYSLTWLIF